MDIFEFHEIEREALKESAFEKWAARVEKILGHDLDGNQETDGYSLDFSLDAFNEGMTPGAYAATVRS